jgi:O-acetylhomoserine/O-acetylserine sulfhydrylase-like pyridoxal-dependent enzyme
MRTTSVKWTCWFRISVGIEAADEIIADLEHALT